MANFATVLERSCGQPVATETLGAIDVQNGGDNGRVLLVDRARVQGLDDGFCPRFSDVLVGLGHMMNNRFRFTAAGGP